MATPPNSSGLFFSSSPAEYPSAPSEEVEELVAQAQTIDRLDPQIKAFLTTNHNDFFTTFTRRINLIRSRSQEFQDCHVTVFDKVLLVLTQNGTNLENAAAIHYFCEEFLAIPANTSGIQKGSILSSAIAASVPVLPAVTQQKAYETPALARSAGNEHIGNEPDCDIHSHPESTLLDSLAIRIGPAMERLWSVYIQAKKDFRADTGHDDKKQHDIAKFLRDTIENILDYLKDKDADQRLLEELQASLKIADGAVTVLHGGKKRTFDLVADGETSGTMAPRRKPLQGSRSTQRDNRRYDHRRDAFRERARGDFPGHTRAFAHHQRSESHATARRNAVTELFPEERAPKRKKNSHAPRPQPGRGHSDIPFGYSRAVDSYQPGK